MLMTLTGETKEAVLNLEIIELTDRDGDKNMITVSAQAHKACEKFEKFMIPHNISLNSNNYILKLNHLK